MDPTPSRKQKGVKKAKKSSKPAKGGGMFASADEYLSLIDSIDTNNIGQSNDEDIQRKIDALPKAAYEQAMAIRGKRKRNRSKGKDGDEEEDFQFGEELLLEQEKTGVKKPQNNKVKGKKRKQN